MTSRRVTQGTQIQGEDEKIIYTVTTTNWASSPTNVVVAVKDVDNRYADVTSDVTSGSSSVDSDVITLPIIQTLTAGHTYRVEVQFASGGSTYECYFDIEAER